MSRFGPDPQAFFEAVYRKPAPWDIGGPQPAMVKLLVEHPPEAPVLDVGCGTGDLAIHIAESGVKALGVDFVQEAIDKARAKARLLPPEIANLVDFRVTDVFDAESLNQSFGGIIDSGLLHLLDPDQSDAFIERLASLLRPGGRLYLHEFAVTFPIPNVPRAVVEEEIIERFAPARGWRILTLRTEQFLSRFAPVAATVACVERV
jgi:2-polyprenyl-3-methyl-5-hydroxy-6-metoxy-1,4-benzoquinol methylase